ncbi:MAG: c-type cytochrome domain-containing protein [Pirellulaceae bacterium]
MQAALVCCWLLGAALAISDDQIGAGHARFETKVRPVLVEHCIECHGANKQEGGLRLDSAEALHIGGDSGPALLAGQPSKSLLVEAAQIRKLRNAPFGAIG